MTFNERRAIIHKIVDIERLLFAIRFPASGSLFFKDSLDPNVKSVDMAENKSLQDTGKFCIGPSTEYLWELYHNQRVDPQVQIRHLSDYLKVAPHLVPKEDQLNLPTIRHPDLSPSNILISDCGDITGLIDWQHATILPIFLLAKIPKHFQNYGDDDSENFRRPQLAEDFANMTSSEKELEMDRYRRRQVHYFYLGYTSELNKAHFQAMGKYNLVLRNRLYDTAGRPWEGDNTSLQAQLIKIIGEWSAIASEDNCPISYSPAEVEECLDRDAKQNRVNEQLQHVRDFIGINIDGLVMSEEFESARAKAELIKNELAEGADTDEEGREFTKLWPFQDHEEID
ncbi:uncharacterized protein RSE6_11239 [Rhynchosporium secalis]|uniref:Aminoglycoside phosphotransferase domain-containing protein n=1 Tax=Rhynchosporium secalis TaxID=38038 RepID=A0A1E1MMI8_RHYSE|nr:uncharacterized protein RSE6_11239 [Rhynchosporium secalis]